MAAGAKQFFICWMALCDLDLIPKVWPPKGSNDVTPPTKGAPMAGENIGDNLAAIKEDRICKCPTRTRPPEPPCTISFAPMEENVPKLKQWISNHYASSAFNMCMHQFLPLVES